MYLIEIPNNISFSSAYKICLQLSGKKILISYESYEKSCIHESNSNKWIAYVNIYYRQCRVRFSISVEVF